MPLPNPRRDHLRPPSVGQGHRGEANDNGEPRHHASSHDRADRRESKQRYEGARPAYVRACDDFAHRKPHIDGSTFDKSPGTGIWWLIGSSVAKEAATRRSNFSSRGRRGVQPDGSSPRRTQPVSQQRTLPYTRMTGKRVVRILPKVCSRFLIGLGGPNLSVRSSRGSAE